MSSSSEERKQRDRDDGDEKDNGAEGDVEMTEEPDANEGKQHPLLALSTDLFVLSLPEEEVSAAERAEITARITERVEAQSMAPFLRRLGEKHGWKVDAAKLAAMEEANAKALAAAEAKITEAHEVAGDTEVREAMLARANLHAQWGDAAKAFEEYNLVFDKTVGIASKVDVLLARMRVALAFDDLKKLKHDIDKAKALIEQGGDWERKNQLAVYEALYLMHTRQFSAASKLLLDAVSTFTTTELFSYSTFVLHAVALSLLAVDRATLRDGLLKSPEILSVIDDVPNLRALLTSLYKCQYRELFVALSALTPTLRRSPYLSPHVKYYLRELRVVAYSQFLRSYKAASLQAMADSFGVSVAFMDAELFRFISAGRIHAKIDKVQAVVDTNRPDKRNENYAKLVKDGDLLLNRMHKLSKVIAL